MVGSGLRVTANKGEQPLKIYWLVDELKKRKIPQIAFAKRLGVTVPVLTGRAGVFPADKVQECIRLLESWEDFTPAPAGGRKAAEHPWNGPILPTGKRI